MGVSSSYTVPIREAWVMAGYIISSGYLQYTPEDLSGSPALFGGTPPPVKFDLLICPLATSCFARKTLVSNPSSMQLSKINIAQHSPLDYVQITSTLTATQVTAIKYLKGMNMLAVCTQTQCSFARPSDTFTTIVSTLTLRTGTTDVALTADVFFDTNTPGKDYMLFGTSDPTVSVRYLQMYELEFNSTVVSNLLVRSFAAVDTSVTSTNDYVPFSTARFLGSPHKVVAALDNGFAHVYYRKPCHPDCLTCSGPGQNECTTCLATQIFVSGRCFVCHPTCFTCTAATAPYCNACPSPLVLTPWFPGTTKYYCAPKTSNTYMDSNVQKFCHPTCATCANGTDQCLTCKVGYFFSPGTSLCITCQNTANSIYWNPTSQNCQSCSANCSNCIDLSTKCTNCPSPAMEVSRVDETCVPNNIPVPQLYFDTLWTSTYKPCDSNCLTCSAHAASFCLSCNPGTYLMPNKTCVTGCPQGFINYNNTTCIQCAWPCKRCDLVANNCTECLEGLLLAKGLGPTWTCTFTGSGFYSDPTNNGSMTSCSANCTGSCSATNASKCLQCSYNLSASATDQQYPSMNNWTCDYCGDGYSLTSNNLCEPCHSNCKTCGPTTLIQCKSCYNGWYLDFYNNRCTSNPPMSNYYNDSTNLIYYRCAPNCLECNGTITTCSKCMPNFFVSGGSCVPVTPGMYVNRNDSLAACEPGCSTCDQDGVCRVCDAPYYVNPLSNTCQNTCPTAGGTILKSSCRPCASMCYACSLTENYCTVCATGLYTTEGTNGCSLCAGSGWFVNVNGNCDRCAPPCLACLGVADNCTACAPPAKPLLGAGNKYSCATNPGPNYMVYLANNTYLMCDPSACDTCFSSTRTCGDCVSSLFYNTATPGTCDSCPAGSFISGKLCIKCDPSCLTCAESPYKCTACSPGLFKYPDSTCGICDFFSKFYRSGSSCLPCSPNCVTCAGSATLCTQCKAGLKYNIAKKTCGIFPCTQGSYLASSGDCEACMPDCKTCNNDTTCTSCQSGKYLTTDTKMCVTCAAGFLLDVSTNRCIPCNPSCATCEISPTHCTSCPPVPAPYLLSDGSCSTCTFLEEYIDGLNCKNCHHSCQQCTGPAASQCIGCHPNFAISGGVCTSSFSCNASSFYNTSSAQCEPCDSNCATCLTLNTTCTSCMSGQYISGVNLSCADCGDGYYVGPDLKCWQCSPSCKTCSVRSTECLTCEAGLFYVPANKSCRACTGPWYTSGNLCLPCDNLCKACTGQADFCTQCVPGTVLQTNISKCVICPDNTYISGSSCLPCDPKCKTCSKIATNCTSCQVGLTFQNNDCITCPSGSFKDYAGRCQPCNSNCLTCDTSSTKCLTCSSPSLLSEVSSTCVSCGNGFYSDGAFCRVCSQNCLTCAGTATACKSCASGMILDNYTSGTGTCMNSCPVGKYLNSTDYFCKPCSPGCAQCFGTPDNCTECSSGMKLFVANSTCIVCNDGHFVAFDGTCKLCDPNCATCVGSSLNCSSCTPSSFLMATNFSCSSSCPPGFYQASGFCRKCVFPCDTCSGPSTCLTCQDGLYIHAISNNCTRCATGNYLNTVDSKCYPCNTSNCISCVGDPNNCTSCILTPTFDSEIGTTVFKYVSASNQSCSRCLNDFTVLRDICYTNVSTCGLSLGNFNKCVTDRVIPCGILNGTQLARNVSNLADCIICPLGWYVTLNGICMKCNSNCTACGPTAEICIACKSLYNVYHVDHTCRLIQNGLFIDPVDSLLKECSVNCTTCSGTFNACTSERARGEVAGTYDLPNGTIGPPPPGMIYSEGSFLNCIAPCVNCLWTQTSCRSCTIGLKLDTSDYTCNDIRYNWVNNSAIMSRCYEGCEACKSFNRECTACYDGYYLNKSDPMKPYQCVRINSTLFLDIAAVVYECGWGCAACDGDSQRCSSCLPGFYISGDNGGCTSCNTNGGSLLIGDKCFDCGTDCLTCEFAPKNCLSCQNGFYLHPDKSCKVCPPDHYVDGIYCKPCPQGCTSCTSGPTCDVCWPQHTLTLGGCVSPCYINQYFDTGLAQCAACSGNCLGCFGSSLNCTSCITGTYYSSTNQTCTACGPGYVVVSGVCTPCDATCATCDVVPSRCLTCSGDNAWIEGYMCKSCNTDGIHLNSTGICSRCPVGCKKCLNSTSECTECLPGYFVSSYGGTGTCSLLLPGFYVDPSDKKIYKCSSKCGTCAKNSTFCLTCPNGQALSSHLEDAYCILCPDGFYTKNGICRPCHSSCRTCQFEAYVCTSCFQNSYLSPNNDTCTSCTGGGFYKTEAGNCLPCDITCKLCQEWTGQCTLCNNAMILMFDRPVCTECKGYKFRGADDKCYFCDVNCADCAGTPTNCTKCTGSFLSIQNSTCGICGAGFFVNGDYCYKCDSSCAECVSWPNHCTACPSGQILMTSNYTCADACPLEHFITPYGECSPCADSCAECTIRTGVCTKCRSGLYISAQTRKCDWCHEESGYYINKTDNRCYKCQDVCHTCNNDSTCTSCEPNYFISETNGTCTPCGDGFFVDTLVNNDKLCKPCSSGCRTCMYNANHCFDCLPGLYFLPHKRTCNSTCNSSLGHYVDLNNFCVPCNTNCTSCIPPHGWCTQCRSGLVVAYLQEQRYCVAPCPDRWYFDSVDSTCKPCSIYCSSCSVTSTHCTSCAQTNDKMWLSTLNATCAPCGDGYFAGPQGKCFPCTGSCTKCPINSTQTCAACVGTNLVVADWGVCVATVPDKTFLTSTWAAAQCSDNCEACDITAATCTRCAQGFVLSVETRTCGACGRGFYELAGLCYRCAADCVECSSLGCSKCQPGLYSQAGLCLPCLPGSTATADGACVACSGGCATCQYLPTNCLSCATTGHTVSALNLTCGPCGDGYFTSPQDGRCYQCDLNCKTCTTRSKTCTSCSVSILSALNYTCAPCGPGYFQDATDSRCYKCGPNCLACQGSKNSCTSCKSPLMVTLPGNNCTDCTFSPTYMVQNGQCVMCQGNCYSCFGTQTNCTVCNPSEYVINNDINTLGSCGTCTATDKFTNATHCINCSANCRSCSISPTNCLTCAPPNYLRRDQNNTCSPSCNAVEGVYSITVAGGFSECLACDPTCRTCSGSAATSCSTCRPGEYLATNSSCQKCVEGCQNCSNSLVCDICFPNYRLQNNLSCLLLNCPNGEYVDGNLCKVCSANCANCFGSAASCTSCIAGQYLSATNTCVPCTENGYYHNSTNCLQCDSSCLTCTGPTLSECSSCNANNSYYSKGECKELLGIPFTFKLLPGTEQASDQYDLNFRLTISGGLPNQEELDTTFWKAILINANITVSMTDNTTNAAANLRTDLKAGVGTPGVLVLLAFIGHPTQRSYNIKFDWTNNAEYTLWNHNKYVMVPGSDSSVWKNPLNPEEINEAASKGDFAGALMGTGGNINVEAASIISVILAGDPTGVTTKFSQSIKIMSRLLYLNVPYGTRVKKFLEQSDTMSGTLREDSFSIVNIKTNAYHGRLTVYKVLVDADYKLLLKIILYMASWFFRLVNWYIIANRVVIPKMLMVFLYFWPKLHLILFNMIVMDFCFYMSRTLLHSIETNSRIVAFVVLMLVALDVLTVADLVWRDEPWLEVYRRTQKEKKRDKELLELSKELREKGEIKSRSLPPKDLNDFSAKLPIEGDSDASQHSPFVDETVKKNSTKIIDYDKTYRTINYNMHLMAVMSSQLSDRKEVLSHRGCRSHFLIHSARIVVYQLILIVSQYMFTTACVLLATMEFARIILTSYFYFSKRHYGHVIHFIMDVSQSCFLFAFLSIAFMLTQRNLAEEVPLNQEMASIYIVFVSCFLEYFLTFAYLIVMGVEAAVFWVRTRKVKDYIPDDDSIFDFIKYYTVVEPEEPASKPSAFVKKKLPKGAPKKAVPTFGTHVLKHKFKPKVVEEEINDNPPAPDDFWVENNDLNTRPQSPQEKVKEKDPAGLSPYHNRVIPIVGLTQVPSIKPPTSIVGIEKVKLQHTQPVQSYNRKEARNRMFLDNRPMLPTEPKKALTDGKDMVVAKKMIKKRKKQFEDLNEVDMTPYLAHFGDSINTPNDQSSVRKPLSAVTPRKKTNRVFGASGRAGAQRTPELIERQVTSEKKVDN